MHKTLMLFFAALLFVACGDEKNDEAAEAAAPPSSSQEAALQASAPVGSNPSADDMERQRFDPSWRQEQSFRDRRRVADAARRAKARQVDIRPVTGKSYPESLEDVDWSALDRLPVHLPIEGDVSGPSVLRTQILLDEAHFSPGAIDGRWGKNTEIAIYWFQSAHGIEPTGKVDEETYRALLERASGDSFLARHSVTQSDLKGPFVAIPESPYEKEELDCMCYESVAEKLAEDFHTTRAFLETLNPNVDFSKLSAGQQIVVPSVRKAASETSSKIARIVISVKGWYLHAFDANDNLIHHAPTTLGSQYDPSPTETLKITAIAFDPWFHYQPKLFHEVPDDEPEAKIPPGPNSPVGVVWMQLSKENYGIHGTSAPETIGYASSHGCIRLTNWDARDVGRQVEKGVKVEFTDTRS